MSMFYSLLESITPEEVMYHATYKPLLGSIMKFGLRPDESEKRYEDSEDYVYLANDPDVAESYAEVSDMVDEEWLDDIVILKVDVKGLNRHLLQRDPNVIDGDSTFIYPELILPEYLTVV